MNDELVNKGWKQMELLLEERMPVTRKRRYAGYYWLAGAAIVLLALSAMYLFSDRTDNISAATSQANEYNKSAVTSENNQGSQADKTSSNTSLFSTATDSETRSNSKANLKTSSASNTGINSTSQKTTNASTQNESSSTQMQSTQAKSEKSIQSINEHINPANSKLTERDASGLYKGENNTLKAATPVQSFHHTANHSIANQTFNSTTTIQQDELISNLQEDRNASVAKMSISPTLFPLDRIDLLALNLINHNHNQSAPLTLTSLEIKPRPTAAKQIFRWQLYVDGLVGNDMKGTNLGVNMVHRITNKLSLTTGIELAYYEFNKFNRNDGAALPTSEIFTNAATYSGYLADNSIKSSEFITSVTTIFAPIDLRYSICDKMELAIGIRPGIQVDQKLSYAPIANQDISRNPAIEDGELTAQDFFYQKSVATVQTSFGINYHFSPKFSVGTFYRQSLSDYGRSVQYASSSRLDQMGAAGVDRRFYSIGNKALSSNLFGLRLGYKF